MTPDPHIESEKRDPDAAPDKLTGAQALLAQMGGISGLIYSSLPVVVFVPVNSFFDLRTAIYAALGVAALLFVVRLVRREPLTPAISGLLGVAICVFIAEANPAAGLLPADPLEKALALSWLQWCSFRQAQSFFPGFMPQRFIEGDAEAAKLRAASIGRVAEAMRQAAGALSRGGGHLGGERPGLADYYLFMQERWAARAFGLELPAECREHQARMAARPAVARVMETEGLAP